MTRQPPLTARRLCVEPVVRVTRDRLCAGPGAQGYHFNTQPFHWSGPQLLTYIRAKANISVMELTVSEAAHQFGRSDRFVQQAINDGRLAGHRRLGRQVTVDDIAARAWARALGRGRVWAPETAAAALDLLENGETTRLSSSERSRLRSRLRSMSAQQIAHATGGVGVWARYRGTTPVDADSIGPSAVAPSELGLVGGNDWMAFVRTDRLDSFELDHDVVLDADGNLGVVERNRRDDRQARALLDTYLLGDARQSAAAGDALEDRARR